MRIAIAALAIAIPVIAFVAPSIGSAPISKVSRPSSTAVPVSIPKNGRLVKWLVKEGDFVQRGQVIAELDSSDLKTRLALLEAKLAETEAKGQAAIESIGIGGISGSLPKIAPEPIVIKVPVKSKVSASTPDKPEPPKSAPAVKPIVQPSVNKRAMAERAKTAAEEALKRAKADLESKQAKAEEASKLAEVSGKKAEEADALLANGVISEQRLKEIKDTDAQAEQNLAYFLVELESAKRDLKRAEATLDSAEAELAKAKEQPIAMVPEKPEAAEREQRPSDKKPSQAKEATTKYETKYVLKSVPTAHAEAPSAAPVKVFVDQDALKDVSKQRQELVSQIQAIKKEIDSLTVVAPTDGAISLRIPEGAEFDPSAVLAVIAVVA